MSSTIVTMSTLEQLTSRIADLLLDSSSLLIVVNLVFSWFNRSSTTAASSAELSVLVLKLGDCYLSVKLTICISMHVPLRRWAWEVVSEE